jgi:hypothetical protein
VVAGNVVPEPSTWVLMAPGFAGLGFAGWSRRAASSWGAAQSAASRRTLHEAANWTILRDAMLRIAPQDEAVELAPAVVGTASRVTNSELGNHISNKPLNVSRAR